MRKVFLPLVLILIFSCNRWNVSSKKPFRTIDEQAKIASKYIEIPNDPLKVKEYTLENGLKIFISENHDEPRIQTLVMVKAGSVNDPANATGLAHYLEHMLFKGNDKIGTINFEAEKIELNKIKLLFEDLRVAKDTILRKKIYHQIDSISGVAAKYSCPNEIDQLFTQIGAKGTNAFTSKCNNC